MPKKLHASSLPEFKINYIKEHASDLNVKQLAAAVECKESRMYGILKRLKITPVLYPLNGAVPECTEAEYQF